MKAKIELFAKTCVIFLSFSVLAMNCYAGEIEGKWLEKTVKVGDKEFVLKVLNYSPTLKATLSEKPGSRSGDSVDFLFYFLNQMRNGNYNEWLSTWDEKSLDFMEKSYADQKITPDLFVKKWKDVYKTNTEINVLSKVIYSNDKSYEIIRYYINYENEKSNALKYAIMVFVDNKWKITQVLMPRFLTEDKILINLEKILESDKAIVHLN